MFVVGVLKRFMKKFKGSKIKAEKRFLTLVYAPNVEVLPKGGGRKSATASPKHKS